MVSDGKVYKCHIEKLWQQEIEWMTINPLFILASQMLHFVWLKYFEWVAKLLLEKYNMVFEIHEVQFITFSNPKFLEHLCACVRVCVFMEVSKCWLLGNYLNTEIQYLCVQIPHSLELLPSQDKAHCCLASSENAIQVFLKNV